MKSERLFLLKMDGRIRQPDMEELHSTLASDPDRLPNQNVLCDLSELESADLTFAQIMGLTGLRTGFYTRCNGVRVAVWAPNDIGFGMARMYLALVQEYEGIAADVFRNLDQAAACVGCDPDVLQRL